MELLTADYVALAITVAAAIWGLFIGFSGALAFLAALAAATVVGHVGWQFSAVYLTTLWARALATLVATLLSFGLTRALVRKLVHGLVAQPADAIFGCLVAAFSGAAVSLGGFWLLGHFSLAEIPSTLLERICT